MPSSSKDLSSKGKKRKSLPSGADSQPTPSDVKVVVSDPSSSAGPVFANFPSVRPSKNTSYTVYTRDPGSSSSVNDQHTLLVGETEDVEFFSTNQLEKREGDGSECQYVAALYDPSTQTLHIQNPTPLYLMAHRAKRLKLAASVKKSEMDSRAEYKARRNDLGEVFGTRKAKSQIRAEERNRVDVGAMQGVKGHLMEAIPKTAMLEEAPPGPSELIPTPNLETSQPDEVYPRESLILSDEWSAISVSELLKATDDKERVALLPYRRSRWIEAKMRSIINGPPAVRKANLKYIYYLAALLHFQDQAGWIGKTPSTEIASKFRGVPPQVLNGMLSRFAEGSGKKYTVTEKMRTKLFAYICTLYLLLDGWTVEVGKVAKELSLTDAKVINMYKSLGCQVEIPTPAEREKLGLSMSEAQKARRAVLKAPVKFPKTKMRGPAKRQNV
ncbi:DNA-directed RNA polymerase I subunit rpa49 [Saitozyma podzolica]|uniref:DNA-directed RNA polymerase I subunit rpa49 n=1 Tax=Saitozyma podzolica TaxID=1890683 RepID=A0A427YJD9_9TREE|nr:DNA-directed RNA polymerase I subunit rpa49 [Saitozyma podzolica]